VLPRKRSVALAVYPPGRQDRLLLVRRPEEPGEDLPGVWGLPAVSLEPGEDEEAGALRVAREKLGVPVRLRGRLAEGRQERPGYTLEMAVYEAELAGPEPSALPRGEGRTYYTAWRWGTPEDLEPARRQGSLCSALYLSARHG